MKIEIMGKTYHKIVRGDVFIVFSLGGEIASREVIKAIEQEINRLIR